MEEEKTFQLMDDMKTIQLEVLASGFAGWIRRRGAAWRSSC